MADKKAPTKAEEGAWDRLWDEYYDLRGKIAEMEKRQRKIIGVVNRMIDIHGWIETGKEPRSE